MNRARLNNFEFRCRTCLRQYQPGTVRIVGRNCASCAHAEGWLTTHEPRRDDARSLEPCANCAKPFGHRRIVTNSDGQQVHYRCPTTTRAMRRQLAQPPP